MKKSALIPLCWYLHLHRGQSTGINFIDSTSLEICLNERAKRNRVFKGLANWGKSSLGWYFGFKLHLIINEFGEILYNSVASIPKVSYLLIHLIAREHLAIKLESPIFQGIEVNSLRILCSD